MKMFEKFVPVNAICTDSDLEIVKTNSGRGGYREYKYYDKIYTYNVNG